MKEAKFDRSQIEKKEPEGIAKVFRIAVRILALPIIALIKIYQIILSPLFPSSCRFVPTCSQYNLEALKKYGIFKGLYLGIKRLLRCHPWGGSGYDPVP